jgi:4-aminobutyrate aminotransferase-like enzyme
VGLPVLGRGARHAGARQGLLRRTLPDVRAGDAAGCLDFFGESPFRTISSFAWSNVGARISHAALEETERVLPATAALGDRIHAGCARSRRVTPPSCAVRRTGLLFALDFADDAAGFGFLAHMFLRGVLVVASSQRQDVVKLYPPLVLEAEQVDLFLEAAEGALGALR